MNRSTLPEDAAATRDDVTTLDAHPSRAPGAVATPATTRLGPLAGIGLTLLALLVPSPESPAAVSGPALRAWVAAEAGTIRLFTGAMAVSAVLLVAFAADLRSRMRPATSRPSLPDVAFGAAMLCATWLLVSGGLNAVLGYDTSDYTNEQLVAFYSMGQAGDMIGSASTLAKGALMLAVSVAALRGGFLPRWIAWLGVGFGTIALGNVLGILGIAAGGEALFYAGLFAFALWPAFVGAGLLVGPRRRRRPAQSA